MMFFKNAKMFKNKYDKKFNEKEMFYRNINKYRANCRTKILKKGKKNPIS